MRAVMAQIPPDLLAWRKRTGADRWDEVWEGVLHMVPSPNIEHQDLEGSLEVWLRIRWARPRGGNVYHNVNVSPGGEWRSNYRIPDLVVLGPGTRARNRGEYIEGPPDVVIEIRSPGDESLEKLGFYASLGVPEVWVIDRDSKAPAIYRLADGDYGIQAPDADGWLRSGGTGVELRSTGSGKLAIRLTGDAATLEELP